MKSSRFHFAYFTSLPSTLFCLHLSLPTTFFVFFYSDVVIVWELETSPGSKFLIN